MSCALVLCIAGFSFDAMQISYLVLAFALRTQYRFFATATSGIFELEEAKDDGDNRWYDLDLSKEEREALKIVFNVLFLAVACSTLFVPMFKIWHPAKGVFDRFHVGVLCASTFLLGSMCFISFWYSINFGVSCV